MIWIVNPVLVGVATCGLAVALAGYSIKTAWDGWPFVVVLALVSIFSFSFGGYLLRIVLKAAHEPPAPNK